jgi:hypothetical protein
LIQQSNRIHSRTTRIESQTLKNYRAPPMHASSVAPRQPPPGPRAAHREDRTLHLVPAASCCEERKRVKS